MNDCIRNLNENNSVPQKQELINKLSDKKKQVLLSVKPHSKKPPAPKPPPRFEESTPPNGVSPCFDLRPIVSQQHITEERELSSSKSTNDTVIKGKDQMKKVFYYFIY